MHSGTITGGARFRNAEFHLLPQNPRPLDRSLHSLYRFIRMRLSPVNIQPVGNELAIAWNDGAESFFEMEFLRRACPCAGCGGEPDVMGRVVRPEVSYNGSSFVLRNYRVIGGYALQMEWSDGHNTGLYSYDYLRRLQTQKENTP
jgi:DUF971 family protein